MTRPWQAVVPCVLAILACLSWEPVGGRLGTVLHNNAVAGLSVIVFIVYANGAFGVAHGRTARESR